ncbi:MAG: hypothetical protein WCK84_01955 [Bacteroidota bacterium]
MKTSNRYKVRHGKIHSLKDLELEKHRLKLEIMKTEVNIQSGYRNIINALSFKNLATTMINEVSATSSVLSKAFAIGKSIMTKRKKKKIDKSKATINDLPT